MATSTDAQKLEESKERTLDEFGRCADFMRKVLYQDSAIRDTEFLFIENHFHVLEMAYLRWKRKHQPHSQWPEAETRLLPEPPDR